MLIVGCGPTGLTLAAQLAAFPEIKTRIVDQKSGPLQLGQADGIACRTMEMFEAFGFSERVLKEAYWVNETTFWKPDDKQREHIVRSRQDPGRRGRAVRIPARRSSTRRACTTSISSHAQFAVAAGARLFAPFAGSRRRRCGRGSGAAAHPVTVRFERLDPAHAGQVETVEGALRGRLRRRAQRRAPVARAHAARRLRQSGLGRDGCARRHRLPRRPPQIGDPVRQRGQRAHHSRARAAISSASTSRSTSSAPDESDLKPRTSPATI